MSVDLQPQITQLLSKVAQPATPCSEALALILPLASSADLKLSVRWITAELTGYKPGGDAPAGIHDILGCDPEHFVARSVEDYRVRQGTIQIVLNGDPIELPISKFFQSGVPTIEALIHSGAQRFGVGIRLDALPPENVITSQIREQASRRGRDSIQAEVEQIELTRLLAGLRSTLLLFLSDCLSPEGMERWKT